MQRQSLKQLYAIFSFAFACLLLSCSNDTSYSSDTITYFHENSDSNLLNKIIHEKGEIAYDLSKQENKLIGDLIECNNRPIFKEVTDYNQYIVAPFLKASFERQSDLIIASEETTSRDVADTLYFVRSVCDITITNKFIKNGYQKIIESDLKNYEVQIQGEDAYKHYGSKANIQLKKYWKDHYNSGMYLGEIIALLHDIRIIVYHNSITIEKNALFDCCSKQ